MRNKKKNSYNIWAINSLFVFAFLPVLFFSKTATAADQFTKVQIDDNNPNAIGRTAIGDIDGDGKNDIVLHAWGTLKKISSTLTEVNSDGILSWYQAPSWAKKPIASGKQFYGNEIQIADIDGDGDNDVVAPIGGNTAIGIIMIYENTGQGNSWAERTAGTVDTTGEAQEMHVLDVDKDGKLDVAIRSPQKATVLYQNSISSWEIKQTTIVLREGSAMGDVDADGYPDFIANGFWLRNPGSSTPGVLPANRSDDWTRYDIDTKWADPNLKPPICSGTTALDKKYCDSWRNASVTVQFADLDNNGIGEIIIAHAEHKGFPVTWYKNKIGSNGKKIDPKTGISAWEKHELEVVNFSHSLQAQDYDNDGWIDILAGSTVWNDTIGTEQLTLFINNRDSTFPEQATTFSKQVIAAGNDFVYAGRTGDIDNDGDIDFTTAVTWGSNSPILDYRLRLWRNNTKSGESKIDSWTYKMIDGNRDKYNEYNSATCRTENCRYKYFGIYADDVSGDGRKDIVSGKYVYISPNDPLSNWTSRATLPVDADGALIANIDNDNFGDVIAFGLPDIYWFEATNTGGTAWTQRKKMTFSGTQTDHKNPQGWRLADLDKDNKPEILFEGGKPSASPRSDGIYALKIPADPNSVTWTIDRLTGEGGDGIGVGDIDNDGNLDLAIGQKSFKWYVNPSGAAALNPNSLWTGYSVGTTEVFADRFEIARIDNDNLLDITVCEETYPQPEDYPTKCFWFKNPGNPKRDFGWTRKELAIGHALQSLQILDMDGDGDNDAVVGEHKEEQRIFVYENNSSGIFEAHLIGAFRESHGLYVADINKDNNPDIMHIGWSEPKSLHLWVNRNGSNPISVPSAPNGLTVI